MEGLARFRLLIILTVSWSAMVHGQQGRPASENRTDSEKTVIVTSEALSNSTIAVPPATSVRFGLTGGTEIP